MQKIFITLILSITISGFVSAQSGNGTELDPFYGTISTSVAWDLNNFPGGTVYIGKAGVPASTFNDITIISGGHLTIGAGITVIFLTTTSDLIITGSGQLDANGNSSASITFTKGSLISHWGHISFETPGTNTPITGTGSFKYCHIEYGYAVTSGQNPDNGGGGMQVNANNVIIENCSFNNNISSYGGALGINSNMNATIKNCLFLSNNASTAAGALLIRNGSASIVENCIFNQNSCTGAGTIPPYSGGAIWTYGNTTKFINNTFYLNTTKTGYTGDAIYSYSSPGSVIINSVFWGSGNQIGYYGTSPSISYSAFQTTKPLTATNSIVISGVAGNHFTNPTGGDLSLLFISPCRDAGTTPSPAVPYDYLGNPRILAYDIGAYEVQYSKWKTTAPSTDWNTAANWDGGVPTITHDVIVPTGATNYPTGSPSQDFTIGSAKQLIIEQGARVTLNNLTNNGILKLNSTSAGFASLIVNNYSKGGGATEEIQLFLTGGPPKVGGKWVNPNWHYISSPVASLAASTFSPTFTLDLAQWVEPKPVSSLSQAWVAFDGFVYSGGWDYPNGFSTLIPGKGYNYFKGTDYTYTFGGQLNTADVNAVLSYKSGNDALYGYNLIGNPFSSGLDWDYIITHSFPTNTTKSLYFTKNNTLCTYINGVGLPMSENVNGIIPPMQGFFSKTYSTGNIIVLAAAARTHNNIHATYKGSKTLIPLVRLALTDSVPSDETVVRFDDMAKPDFDYDFDAVKMTLDPSLSSIYTSLSGTNYAINGLPFPETFIEIPVAITIATDEATKSITASQLQALDNYGVTLTDISTGFVADLKTTPSITFSAAKGTSAGRFILKIGFITTGVESPKINAGKFNIYQADNSINIQTVADEWDGQSGAVKVLDLTGKTVQEIRNVEFNKNSLVQVHAPFGKGLYVVEIRSGVNRYVGKVVVK